MVDWISLSVPFLYLTVVLGSLTTFASLYRKRKQANFAALEPWFDNHIARDVYLSLLHLEGDEKVPESVLKTALLRRAVVDLQRLFQIRNSKGALQTLVQRGSVGDDLWQRFLRAEKEIEEELKDVVNEVRVIKVCCLSVSRRHIAAASLSMCNSEESSASLLGACSQ